MIPSPWQKVEFFFLFYGAKIRSPSFRENANRLLSSRCHPEGNKNGRLNRGAYLTIDLFPAKKGGGCRTFVFEKAGGVLLSRSIICSNRNGKWNITNLACFYLPPRNWIIRNNSFGESKDFLRWLLISEATPLLFIMCFFYRTNSILMKKSFI